MHSILLLIMFGVFCCTLATAQLTCKQGGLNYHNYPFFSTVTCDPGDVCGRVEVLASDQNIYYVTNCFREHGCTSLQDPNVCSNFAEGLSLTPAGTSIVSCLPGCCSYNDCNLRSLPFLEEITSGSSPNKKSSFVLIALSISAIGFSFFLID